jgi:hypothetical protein
MDEAVCRTPEDFKAWSQNLGHEGVLTTFTSYGQVASHRQAEIFAGMREKTSGEIGPLGIPDQATLLRMLAQVTARSQGTKSDGSKNLAC